MKHFEPVCIWPLGAELGEGPQWLDDTQQLYFADIKGRRSHRCDARSIHWLAACSRFSATRPACHSTASRKA